MLDRPRILSCCLIAGFVFGLCSPSRTVAADKLEYNRDIRPILSENCFACHGPDSASRKADLRIDRREAVLENEIVVPGKPDESEFVRRILSEDPSEIMPPPKSHKVLKPEQKEILKRWIAEGAEYQPHWSFIAPQRPALPAVKNEAWVRNPIDRFVLARLEALGLSPAPEADLRTLARRAALDLTGLPPNPEDVEALVNDLSPDAYPRYVDKLLQSAHWGEHRGRYWLDAARYADSHGIHFDNYREIWAYRNWVINAFNRNLPFDQFTIEQLAGDLLPEHTLDQEIASGFNRCNITTSEGGAIAEEYLVLYARDRTETTSQVWLGLTTGCAVCHDHKFDPITMKDFYSLSAFFNNTTQAAMDGNIKDTPPTIAVPLPEDRSRFETVVQELATARQAVESRKVAARPDFDAWLTSTRSEAVESLIPSEGLEFRLPLQEGTTEPLQAWFNGEKRPIETPAELAWEDGYVASRALRTQEGKPAVTVAEAGNFEKDRPFSYAAWIWLPQSRMTGAAFARMDEGPDYRGWDLWIENNRPGTHIINKWQDDALKVVANDPIPTAKWTHVCITYDGTATAAGVKIYVNGVVQTNRNIQADALKNTIQTTVPFKVGQRNTQSRIEGLRIQDIRLYGKQLAPEESLQLAKGTRAAWLISKPMDQRTDADKNELFDWWLPAMDQPYQSATQQVATLAAEEAAIKGRGTVAHVMHEKNEDAKAFMLFRGEYDQRRDPVTAATPASLPPLPEGAPHNRLGLAQWLLRPDHPLTTRVTVNRFWQEVFGTGLVKTSGDFGIAGDLPSHPELLDWLAVEFREQGWDVKKFFRMLVTSATYRQSALTTPEKIEKDADNRLLSRGPRFRMDAEMVRDYALAASGLLVEKLGGPSVKPYQPDGVWEAVAMIGSNTRDYRRDQGEGLYRRSMYTFWKRSAPPASMDIFNAPSRETCTVRRERTNTPLQALVTLNDPQFVEAARVLAQRALKEGGATDEQRINYLARHLLARPFTADEAPVVLAGLHDLQEFYKSHAKEAGELIAFGDSKPDATLDPGTLAAWTMLTNELFNLDEVLNK